ncbi:diphthine--ammonia ligase [Fictibacillus sp. NRS-1165]|uniref:Dph6-related ATP pyrophosphatase n=1 Tax=Fictibacillus sp. NRS-1165 TaxID=3144463 RepID=UPI003D1A5C4F
MAKKIVVSFSGGKDSMLALHKLLESNEYEVDSLLTTINEDHRRTSIHGIREEILDAQAKSLGFRVRKVKIPTVCTNEIYEERMREEMDKLSEAGIRHVMFGDIFLADIREYRESKLKQAGIGGVFPLWGRKSAELIDEFLSLGYRTVITTLDQTKLDKDFLGREINRDWIADIPENVDPCGENGEFHTMVVNGPLFSREIAVEQENHTVTEGNFIYRDFKLSE